ncbi:DUF2442 domain-containing protein [bacterium]|nr:MAG: DUF2442 domain-containing protein [bacterium]
MIVIELGTGVEIAIPRRLLQGVEKATPAQAADVKIDEFGSTLRWKSLDVDHYVPRLIDGVSGTRQWMAEIGRANGLEGGRPRTSGRIG